MTTLKEFYNGAGKHPGTGLTFSEIVEKDNEWWENNHDFIQWVFPLPDPSAYNESAPLLDFNTASRFDPGRIKVASYRFFYYLFPNRDIHPPEWFERDNHNILRITRFMKFTKLVWRPGRARDLYFSLAELDRDFPGIISDENWQYWRRACITTWKDYQ